MPHLNNLQTLQHSHNLHITAQLWTICTVPILTSLLCSAFFLMLNPRLCAQTAGLIFLLLPLPPSQDLVSFPSEQEFPFFHKPQERGILFSHGSSKLIVFI